MQPRRFGPLKIVLGILFFDVLILVSRLLLSRLSLSQSAISPAKADLLLLEAWALLCSLFGIGWLWSKGQNGSYRGGGFARWGWVLFTLTFLVGFASAIWNKA